MALSKRIVILGLAALVFGTAFIGGDTNSRVEERNLKREQRIYRMAFDTYAREGYLAPENFKPYTEMIKRLRKSDSF